MGEDSGYFSRRSNEFRLPTHHQRYNNHGGSQCQQQRICCCCSSYDHCSSPSSYECRHVEGPSVGINNDTTILTNPQCSSSHSHHCQCRCDSSNNSSFNNTDSNNPQVRGRCCPYDCDHHHHHHHHPHNWPQSQDPQIKNPYTTYSPHSQLIHQQQTLNDSHNNNPRSSSPLTSAELNPHSSLSYPRSALPATNASTGSISSSGYLCDNNNTPATGVGYQYSSKSSRVGRSRFSPDDLLKLGYEDLLKSPALKRFSYGFQDEQEFEEFKQDLREFQLLKRAPSIAEDSLAYTPSQSGFCTTTPDPTRSSFGISYTRGTSSDSEGLTSNDNIPESVTRRDLIDNNNRDNHHPHQHHNLYTSPNHDRGNFCTLEKEGCDNNHQSGRKELVRNISFSGRNVDRLGRITGTEVLESPNSSLSNSSSVYLPKFSPTSSDFSPATEYGNPNYSHYSPSSASPDNNNKQHGSPSVKRHSARNLSSLQYLTPSSRTTSAPHDMLMDFFKSDEHFQEFEREFANLGRDFDVFGRLRRIDDCDDDEDDSRPATRGIERSSSSAGSASPFSIRRDPSRGSESSVASGSRTPIPIQINYQTGGGSREPTPRTELGVRAGDSGDNRVAGDGVGSFFHPDDTFSDFFNNDEDFKEFEREFANFKLKRRSRAFADDFNRRSNCDLFADLFPGFEGQSPRERRSRTSASDWDYLFNKIKRNSNIFPESTQCPSDNDADEDTPVFPARPNDERTSAAIARPSYQEHPNENQPCNPRKAVEIAILRRPPLPASPVRQYSPEVTRRSPGLQKKPLELKIEHVSSPCSSPTLSSPRTPTGPTFAPRPRTDSPLLLHIDEDRFRDSPGSTLRRVLHFTDDEDNGDEPTTPTNTDQPRLHIDEPFSANNRDDGDNGGIVIEHRFSGGSSTPTMTITRRKKGSASSERSGSPASPLTVRNQQHTPPQQYQIPSSEITDRRRYTDPSKIGVEHRFGDRDSEPVSSKQNRFSTALEFLHDVDANNSRSHDSGPREPHVHNKDCQYTCHEKCRQLVTLDCKNSLPNSGSEGSIETSLSEPASTPGSNSTLSDTSPNCCTDRVSNGEQRLPLGVDIRDHPRESPFQWITKSVREQQPYADLKDLMDWWEWENLQSLYFRHINSQHTLQFTAMLRPQDETDSGYRSGPIPEEILPKKQPSQATLNREDLKRKLQEYNNNVPFANLAMGSGSGCSENMDSGCSMTSSDLCQSGDLEPRPSVEPSQVDSGPSPLATHPAESDSDFHDDDDNNNDDDDDIFNDDHNESDGETFQGFIKVTLNLIRPITMSLGARPPSIYEVLTREHIVEQNTQSISFYMPRDTVKSIHVDSETTTKEVISALLKKFKILDNPRKFAMYEQELSNGKIVKLRRVVDAEFPLQTCLAWGTEDLAAHRLVLQENEATGDIEWSNFSLPELGNFLKVLDREQDEHINQLQYKYRMMKKVILQRLKEIRKCRNDASPTSPSAPTGNGNHSPGGQTQKVI